MIYGQSMFLRHVYKRSHLSTNKRVEDTNLAGEQHLVARFRNIAANSTAMKSKIAVSIAGVFTVLTLGESAIVAETVETTSGSVQGHIASGTSGVSEYLGIPFVCKSYHFPLHDSSRLTLLFFFGS